MGLLSLLFGCSRGPQHKAGALYSIANGEDGSFGVVKMLVVDDQGVHIRVYKEKWKERPAGVDPAALSLGKVTDPDGFGMGHLPLSKKAFASWQPVLIKEGTVAEDELDGYEMWKEGSGQYFGE